MCNIEIDNQVTVILENKDVKEYVKMLTQLFPGITVIVKERFSSELLVH
jgi:hypothetical protein